MQLLLRNHQRFRPVFCRFELCAPTAWRKVAEAKSAEIKADNRLVLENSPKISQ